MVVAGESSSGGRTVVVGMKLDSQSRELLTWALVKVAQAGDWVIALHVLDNNGKVLRKNCMLQCFIFGECNKLYILNWTV